MPRAASFPFLSMMAAALLLVAFPARAENRTELPETKTSLISETAAVAPGAPFWVALRLELKDGWHTYWENPGDAGMPTEMEWTLPPGFTASAIHWPAPKRLMEGPLATYAYEGDLLLLVRITPPALLSGESFALSLKAVWLTCKEICVPEEAALSLSLPAGQTHTPTPDAKRIGEAAARLPSPATDAPTFMENGRALILQLPATGDIAAADFFPREDGVIRNPAPREFTLKDGTLRITIARGTAPLPERMSGVVALTGSDGATRHLDATFIPAAAPAASEAGLPAALLLALLGGVILNLMPCVFPVLSLKALSLAKHQGREAAHNRIDGLAYTLGILLCFALIAGLLIAFQQAGAAVGWGFQMQSPLFVAAMALLLFAVGLNLSGLLTLPTLLGGLAGRRWFRHGPMESLATGALMTLVATPCTAPFMATAIGAALAQPPMRALLIFEALGLGLALPYLLISFMPRLLAFLPKPGAWMEHFRQFLAFPMYLSAVWLLWVLDQQAGPDATAMLLAAMAVLAFAIWAKRLFAPESKIYFPLAIVTLAAVVTAALPTLSPSETPAASGIAWEAFSPERLAALRGEGRPVFVNATAAWCITCKVNERVALSGARVGAFFRRHNITALKADWTRRDAAIATYLASFGRSGVPLYVYYPPSGEPRVLPQLLTPQLITDNIAGSEP